MRKLLIGLVIILSAILPAYAVKLPENVQNFVKEVFPDTTFRFDGVVILPDGTVYLPLIPSQFNTTEEVAIKSTIPEGKAMKEKPDAVILSNDYVLLKMITSKGKNTVINLPSPPLELRTGLLPQDMLVPKNLIIPSTLKNIIGNLNIQTTKDTGLVIPITQPKTGAAVNSLDSTPELKGKVFYIASNATKNILVVSPEKKNASYALAQEENPISMKGYENFLFVTSFGKKALNVISLADEKIIKEIDFKTQPEEIIIDADNKIAYVSSGEDASLYVISLDTMTIKKQLRLNGMCEKVVLSDDGTKLFYNDKQTREIWAVELDNDYLLKEIGRFPNVSKIAYVNGKVYLTSRTKNKLAIIDYETLKLLSENEISEKPVDMLVYGDMLFILGAADNTIDIVDTTVDKIVDTINLEENEFPTRITPLENSNLALITDAKAGVYSILNLDKQAVVKTNKLEIPVGTIYVTNKVKKIGSN